MLTRLFKMEIAENRIFGLDVLRFFAIFMVLLGHSMILAPAAIKKSVNYFLYDGVAVFFVLSGFLIGGIVIKILNQSKATWIGLFDFCKRRWMRTLPVYFVVLTYLLVYTLWIYPQNFPEQWYRFLYFSQNIFGHQRPGFFAEAWSLSIEEWFYLSVPFFFFTALIFLKSSVKKTIFLISLVIIALVTWYRYYLYHELPIPLNPTPNEITRLRNLLMTDIEYQVIPRLDAIMYGVLAAFFAYYFPNWWNNKWNFILLLVGVFLFYETKFNMGKSYGAFNTIWNPSIKSIAVFLMLPFLSNLKRGFGIYTRWITFFSLISYSMYLVNLNVVTISIIKHTIHGIYSSKKFVPGEYWMIDFGLYWIFTIAISFVLYQLIEVPFMKMRDKKRS